MAAPTPFWKPGDTGDDITEITAAAMNEQTRQAYQNAVDDTTTALMAYIAAALAAKADLVDGVVPVNQLSAALVGTPFGAVASEAAMVALDADANDNCIRTDVGNAVFLKLANTGTGGTAFDWVNLSSGASIARGTDGKIAPSELPLITPAMADLKLTSHIAVSNSKTSSFTLAATGNNGPGIDLRSGGSVEIVVTIPKYASVPIPYATGGYNGTAGAWYKFSRGGTGLMRFVLEDPATMTLNSAGGRVVINERFGGAHLIHVGVDGWDLEGCTA